MRHRSVALALATLGIAAWMAACNADAPRDAAAPTAASVDTPAQGPSSSPTALAPVLEAAADPAQVARGAALFVQHECNRCHTIEGIAPPTAEFDCAGCHVEILAGRYPAAPAELAAWQSRIHSLVEVPRLSASTRLRRAWIEHFLGDTHDLRPNLDATMPRFALPAADVTALAAWLAPAAEEPAPAVGDAARGRAVMESKACGVCHRMQGAPALPAGALTIALEPAALARGQQLAPDLAHVRTRMRPAALQAWLRDPSAVEADAAMPKIPLDEAEIRDVAAYLLQTPLQATAPPPIPARPARLERAVSYEEVDARIFHRICRHCHSNPEIVIGDGGPGYSGGFGFPRRALDLNSHAGVLSGSVGDDGQRRSILAPLPDGTPRIVAHLLARHAEVAGAPVPGIRGMPLALPPLPLDDIALLDTWIAQGRRPPADATEEPPP